MGVAAEQLVAAVAAERHGGVLADQAGRPDRWAPWRSRRWARRTAGPAPGRSSIDGRSATQLGVVGAEVRATRRACGPSSYAASAGKAIVKVRTGSRTTRGRPSRSPGSSRCRRSGGCHRHVRHELPANSLLEKRLESSASSSGAASRRHPSAPAGPSSARAARPRCRGRTTRRGPVASLRSPPQGSGRPGHTHRRDRGRGRPGRAPRERGIRHERLQLGGEQPGVAVPGDRRAASRRPGRGRGGAVRARSRKTANANMPTKAVEACRLPIRGRPRASPRCRSSSGSGGREPRAPGAARVVVDLAVENDDAVPGVVDHGLMPAGERSMMASRRCAEPNAAIRRPPERRRRPDRDGAACRASRRQSIVQHQRRRRRDADDAAHQDVIGWGTSRSPRLALGPLLLVVFGVGVDLPGRELARPRMFAAASRAVIIEWSWLLYLCMPLRPTSSRFGSRVEPVADDVQVVLIGVVVDRVGLGHPDDAAVDDLGGGDQARCARSLACRARSGRRRCSSRGRRPRSRSIRGRGWSCRVGHDVGGPVLEVLDAAEPDVGSWM